METQEQKTTTAPAATTAAPARKFVPRTGGAPRGGLGGNNRPGGRGPRRDGRGPRPERAKPEFEQKMLSIRRVTRVVSGGRRFSFSVVLAIGDKKGMMGLGIGKAGDTTLAINKALNDAKKNTIKVRLNKRGTIDHDVSAKYKSARVMLMPNRGRGVVVGSAMRVMVELAGITDITGRVVSGSKDKLNIAQATMKALSLFALPKKARAEVKPVVTE
jgi:small subunit ribosomal protein S5